ncbi:MnhB domain-containing protein [Thermococcus sp.]|uniref:MnhB domain-containing protein n=1 Tax=Thermococcus sp. TaxID=35749 RepID=UPI00262ED73E|nr:MnhB domain-containing protein [Thermococcus sp.]
MGMTLVVKTTTTLVAPFLVTYGAYLALYGYASPGGGFQAGVVLAVSAILLMTAYGPRWVKRHFPGGEVSLLEGFSGLFLTALALAGLLFGGFFFNFLRPYLPGGTIVLFNVGVALKVAAAFILTFYLLSRWVDHD